MTTRKTLNARRRNAGSFPQSDRLVIVPYGEFVYSNTLVIDLNNCIALDDEPSEEPQIAKKGDAQ